MKDLEAQGYEITYLQPDSKGNISLEDFKNALRKDTILVSVMMVNNEVGSVQPIAQMAKLTHRLCPDAFFHTDAVQGFLKVPFQAKTLGADLILLSDVSGILDGKGQRIAEMTAEKAEQLIEQGIITDGMIVKVNAALDAARALGRPVDIASWRHAEQLPALFNGTPIGTRILA